MGVPKFFRYISERYPCLSELVRENQIPEFDNLYLDMNGIIHVCSHPNDFDPHFRMTEEKMFKDITHYIEMLFLMIQPQKLFFMAIDGVAPRAKMNQQRGRRFRSAREAHQLEEEARAKGEVLPSEARFDSNCITPGTEFMVRLQEHLKYFVKSKISTDKSWQKCRVVLSGHETPGEGEHKIMEFIRYMKSKPNYNPDTRHCLYGLDADLIMLGLCSHEPHFSLLREEVKFGKQANKRTTTAEETSFFLLHLSLLREYLEQEFCTIKSILPFKYDLERIIDDWVLMGFMVGNDFIPHLPNLHINSNALPLLYETYMHILPTLDGYINEGGKLNLPRLEEFMKRLSKIDRDFFDEINADLQYFDSKRGENAWLPERKVDNSETFDVDVTAIKASGDLLALIQATEDMFVDDLVESDSDNETALNVTHKPHTDQLTSEQLFEQEFNLYKRDYYITKLGYKEVDDSVLAEQAECYVRALQWTLLYYYRGVGSWCWFYPHHYAPFISDIKDFKHLKLEFEMGKPFLPFQQLLAVLPSASRTLLPEAYQKLMTSEDSPVIQYYPTEFETDLNGKKQDWEAVVLIPFIEENLLINSMTQCESKLTLEEISRNIHGPMLQYDYTNDDQGKVEAPKHFPDLIENFAKETKVYRADVAVPEEKLVLGVPAAAKLDVYFPGFPTMKHLNYTSRIDKAGVKVFEHPSRNENMIIEICTSSSEPDITDVARSLLGKSIFVAWPHLREAKVESVSDITKRYYFNSSGSLITEENTGNLLQLWKSHKQTSRDHYMNRLGIDIGESNILVHVNLLEGRKYIFGSQGKITLEKQFSKTQSVYPLQACVKDITVHDTSFIQYKSLEEIFYTNRIVFMIGQPYYGSMGNVIDANPRANKGRVKVNLVARPEPDLSYVEEVHRATMSQYINGYDAASKVGISNNILGRVTGTVFVVPGEKQFRSQLEATRKVNVGLNLKLTKRMEELSGYCRRVGNTWLYSSATIKLLRDYSEKYPKLFEMLGKGSYNDIFYESDLFPNEVGTGKLEELSTWLKQQPFSKAERRPCGSEAVDKTVVADIQNAIQLLKKQHSRNVVIYLKPLYLHVPGLQQRSLLPDSNALFRMFDRVISIRESFTVPIGRKGTVIAMHKVQDPNPIHQNNSAGDLLLDVLFDEPFLGGFAYEDVAENCVYRVTPTSVLNLSHGIRSENNAKKVASPKKMSPLNKSVSHDSPYNVVVKGGFIEGKNMQVNSVLQAQLAQDIQPISSIASPAVYSSNTVQPTQEPISFQFKLWEDLLTQQQNKTLVQQPLVNNAAVDSTEILKKVLGVSSTPPSTPPKPAATPVEIKLNVEDMFNHARANKSTAAPVLPQPPQQWYGGKKEMPSANQNWPNRPIIQQNENKKSHHQKNYSKSNHVNSVASSPKAATCIMQQQNQQPRVQHHINLRQQMNGPQYPNSLTFNEYHYPNQPQVGNQLIKPQENLMQGLICNKANQTKSHSNNPKKSNKQIAATSTDSSFIPLQAIKKERLRNHSTSQDKDIAPSSYNSYSNQQVPQLNHQRPQTKEEIDIQIRQETCKKRQIIQQKQEESQHQFQKYLLAGQPTDTNKVQPAEQKPEEKPRQRKSRIAANFAGLK